ncbi:MAG: hypothetical protein WC979_05880 [Candidatus Pacearchaeota archaeon]|jgi:hypothetical protein
MVKTLKKKKVKTINSKSNLKSEPKLKYNNRTKKSLIVILIIALLILAAYLILRAVLIGGEATAGDIIIDGSRLCRDTDTGQDVYKRGTISYGFSVVGSTAGATKISTDSCVLILYPFPTFEFKLKEFYCLDEVAYSAIVSCPEGYKCSRGACVER